MFWLKSSPSSSLSLFCIIAESQCTCYLVICSYFSPPNIMDICQKCVSTVLCVCMFFFVKTCHQRYLNIGTRLMPLSSHYPASAVVTVCRCSDSSSHPLRRVFPGVFLNTNPQPHHVTCKSLWRCIWHSDFLPGAVLPSGDMWLS